MTGEPFLAARFAAAADTPLYHLPGFHEPFSAISHLVGVVAFAWAGWRLIRRSDALAPDPQARHTRRVAVGVYVGSAVFLMAMSGVYHMMVTGGTAKAVMRRLDYAAIFVLIAGTFTPLHALLFRGGFWRWGALAIIWGLAVAGILVQVLAGESLPEWVGLSFYLGLGWAGLVSGWHVWRRHGFPFVAPLVWGGVAYSAGAAADFARWPILIPGVLHGHEVLHLAVLVGAAFHYAFVRQVVGILPSDASHPEYATIQPSWAHESDEQATA
jgi:channel protein (hemolysin III family)